MSKMSQLSYERDMLLHVTRLGINTFSAWSADGKSEVQLESPISPDRLIGEADEEPTEGGSICYLEDDEIETIKHLMENCDELNYGHLHRNILRKLYERIK